MRRTLDRRRFLTLGALASGALHSRRLTALPFVPRSLERRGAPKKVIVLGAGLAGLVAARELVEAGHDVTILEASTRPGGRVHTLRQPFSDGLHAEAGAGRIPDTHTVTLHYVKLFGLALDPFWPTEGDQVACLRGQRIRFKSLAAIDMSKVPFDLTPEERKLGLDGIEGKYLRSHLGDVGDPESAGWPSEKLEALEELTIGELFARQGASRDAIAFLSSGFEDDGALDFLRDAVSHNTEALFKIRGGNDQLPKAFAARLSERIRYGARAVEIRQQAKGVEVVTLQAGETQRVTADRLVCAIPFAVLRHLTVVPDFPAPKRAAIDGLWYGAVTRVQVQTRRRFWKDEGLNGFALVDRPMEIWSPTWNQPGTRGILTAYEYEAFARETAARPETERIRSTLDLLEKVHPGLQQQVEGAAVTCWDEEPFARGAYTMFHPRQLTSGLPETIARPEGRIHFAGEHASPYPGWMQGALLSGLRAAREVNEAA